MMRKLLSLILALSLLCSLSACGGDDSSTVEEKSSAAEVSEVLGYDLLEPEADGLTFSAAAVVDEVIGQAEYLDGDSTVTLRMTLDETLLDGLAGYENAGMAGGVDAPSDVFSTLEVYVIDGSIYYCEFSFTSSGCTCYLSLAKTKTDFADYSALLIDYVNQLYNLEEVPGFVYAVDPDFVLEEEDAEEETTASSEVQTLSLEYNDITLTNVGDSYTFSPTGGDGTYSWESENRSIAIVSPTDGTVTAVASGTTTITCTSGDGQTAEVIVRVP